MKHVFFTLLLVLLSGVSAFAQGGDRMVSGIVSDEYDLPLPGVNVVVQGTTIGTITDLDGNYSITVPNGYNNLVYSFIGYKTLIQEVGANKTMNLVLKEDLVGLDEVVVTALGVKKESKALGYAAQTIDTDEILQSNEQNIVTALSSKAAGVQITSNSGSPGAGAAIRIRGNSTITGNNSPLFIVDGVYMDNSSSQTEGAGNAVDGVAYSNRLIDINSNDIADITILKGIAATALYGTRAANGAVVITTKRGNSGQKGLNIEYRGTYGIEQVNKLPELQSVYSQGSNGAYAAPVTGTSSSWGPKLSDLATETTMMGDEEVGMGFDINSNLVPQMIFNEDSTLIANPAFVRDIATPINNMNELFQTGTNSEHYLSFSGGDEKASFVVSGGVSTREGVVPQSTFRRYNFRASGDVKLSSMLKVFANLNYANSGGLRIQQGSNTSGLMLGLMRTPPSFQNSAGAATSTDPIAYLQADGRQRSYRGAGIYDNPFWTINQNPFQDDVNRFFGNVGASVQPKDWLDVTYRVGVDMYTDTRKQIFAIGSATESTGKVIQDNYFRRNVSSDLILTATKEFNDWFDATFRLGHNYDIRYVQNLFTTVNNLSIPDFYNISNGNIDATLSGENVIRRRIQGIYGQADLVFARMLYLTGTLRRDQATTFGDFKNSFLYPSVSLGFIFTEALGLADDPVFSFGKVRLSYGEVGIEPRAYSTRNIFVAPSYQGGYLSGAIGLPWGGVNGFAVSNILRNGGLQPEIQEEFEVGADLRFFQGRLNVDVSYYNRVTNGVLLDLPLAGSSGYTFSYQNSGTISNKGWEVVLGLNPIKSKNFNWDLQFNFTKNNNLVEELAEGVENVSLSGFTGAQSRAVAGHPMGTIFGSAWLKDSNGNVVIESDPSNAGYGFPINDPVERVLGDPNPDFLLDIRNTFSLKNGVSFSFLLNRKEGGVMWNGTRGALTHFGAHSFTLDRNKPFVFDGVKGTLDGTDEDGEPIVSTQGVNDISVIKNQGWYSSRGGGFGGPSETFVEDASWWRLREVSVSFGLPQSLMEKGPFVGGSITIVGRNLWLNTPFTGIDPDTNLTGNSNNGIGMEYFNMPNTKSYAATLSLRF